MLRTLISQTPQKIGEEVILQGWVNARRDHGKIIFIDLRDRTGLVQLVCNNNASDLRNEDVIEINGLIQKRPASLINPKLETGEIEIAVSEIKTLAKAEKLPFDMGQETLNLELPTLLDHRSLTLRHSKVKTIFKIQAAIIEGFRKAAKDLDCTEIIVPTIAASATEGGAEVFKIDYFDHQAYLTQSPQLYKQMLVPVFERVFTIAKAYRAEPSVTTRHLTESTQMDCEFGFVDFDELLNLLEYTGTKMLRLAESICAPDLEKYQMPKVALGEKIPRLTLREAQEIIYQETKRDNRQEKDLTPQDEVDICQWALQKHQSDFVTITHFPTLKRAFYTKPDSKDPEYSLSYDLLFRGMEICSGSQRINDYDELVDVIRSRSMDPKNFEMYLMAFKYGMPPEGGFSFGLERITKNFLQLENIREASLFPRDMERVDIRLNTKTNNL
ncbi:MAG: Aspartyl-tRNA synthetase [Parcubacteria group bacterium GW2011_GWA2_39_18]|nr:MAG: Aspartyl-tRNA synthetase [Parcubacteria group bacterium GW2011_GWA2_39_18]